MARANNNEVHSAVALEGFEETAQEISQAGSPQLLLRHLKQTQQGESNNDTCPPSRLERRVERPLWSGLYWVRWNRGQPCPLLMPGCQHCRQDTMDLVGHLAVTPSFSPAAGGVTTSMAVVWSWRYSSRARGKRRAEAGWREAGSARRCGVAVVECSCVCPGCVCMQGAWLRGGVDCVMKSHIFSCSVPQAGREHRSWGRPDAP